MIIVKMNSKGFTLIEIVIAVTIMAFLSTFTAMSISQAIRDKKKIETRLDQQAAVRDVMNFMVRDIELAFNYRDISDELLELATKSASGNQNPNANPASSQQQQQQKQKPVTQFIGQQDRIDFSSLGNIRTQANSPESSQAEISYYVKSCSGGRKCLWRRVTPYIDEDINEGGQEIPLLPNVSSLTFRYLGPEYEEDWTRSWRSDGRGTKAMEGKFPYAVEVTMEVEPEDKSLEQKMKISRVARIRFPNNKEKEKAANGVNQ